MGLNRTSQASHAPQREEEEHEANHISIKTHSDSVTTAAPGVRTVNCRRGVLLVKLYP